MNLILNGQPHACADRCSVAQLLESTGHAQHRVAVEVNRRIVPRPEHASHTLHDGDHVEIVHAIGGG